MAKKLKFGILRNESKFSDLSPSLQSLFNPKAVETLRKQEKLETEEAEEQIEDELVLTLLEQIEQEASEPLTETEKENLKTMIEEKIAEIIAEGQAK